MLKKTITYTDYNDEERIEDFYFNLTKAELTMMEASKTGGLKRYLERILQTKDMVSIADAFRAIIRDSYGEKSADGRRFVKSSELSDAFEQTEAYSILVMELLEDPENAAAFVQGIMPKDLAAAITPEATEAALKPAGK